LANYVQYPPLPPPFPPLLNKLNIRYLIAKVVEVVEILIKKLRSIGMRHRLLRGRRSYRIVDLEETV
jgi:hypothetical protein